MPFLTKRHACERKEGVKIRNLGRARVHARESQIYRTRDEKLPKDLKFVL